MRRILPAVGLFFLAPLVSEFLLGDLPITMLGALVMLAPMYGGGALLIREIVRRTGRGWDAILVLALAYSILEEAFATQTLFNPNYLGLNLHLLDPGYIPALGIGAWWTIFVLTLHTVWSISVSIGLMEALVPDRATQPWLGKLGLSIDAVLFLLAAAAMTAFSIKQDHSHFIASPRQFVSSAVIFLVVVLVAFALPRPTTARTPGSVPSPWAVGVIALLLSSLFEVVPIAWGWRAIAAYLALDAIAIAIFSVWSLRAGWNSLHRLALAGGAALTYAWHAFTQNAVVGGSATINRISHVVFGLALIVLLWFAVRRTGAYVRQSGIQESIAA